MANKIITIGLTWGSGFTGANYQLVITEYITLKEHSLGNKEDQELAKIKASEILKERGIDVNLDDYKFEYDGSL